MKKLSFLMMCFAFSVNASAQVNVSVDKDVATIEIKGEAGQLYAKSCARAQISLADALGSATTIQLTGGGNVNDADFKVHMNAKNDKSADINLDMAGVYIDKISTAMNIGGWSDGGSSTFAKGADSWYVWQPISNIKRFVFPEISGDNKNVPNHALHTFSNVEEIVVPASYSTLDARAFAGREKLVSITIGEEGIDGYATTVTTFTSTFSGKNIINRTKALPKIRVSASSATCATVRTPASIWRSRTATSRPLRRTS